MKRSFVFHLLLSAALSVFLAAPALAGPGDPSSASVADLDGDARADLSIHQDSTNKAFTYFLDGTSVLSQKTIKTVPAGWTVVGNGDVDGNLAADLVIINDTTRKVFAYFLSNSAPGTIDSQKTIKTIPAGWVPAGLADVDGNGVADLIIYETATRKVFAYLLDTDGNTISNKTLKVIPAGWEVAGFGDVDASADGTDDLVIYEPGTRKVFVYYFDGSANVTGQQTLKVIPSGWLFEAVADVDNNSTADLVITDAAARKVFVYRFSDSTPGMVTAQQTIKVYPAGWAVAGLGDLDDNGSSDLVIYNDAQRKAFAYLLDNSVAVDSQDTIKVIPVGWLPLEFGFGGPTS